MLDARIVIVGGGLSGLALADQLSRSGKEWVLLEARARLGGRVLSVADPNTATCFDVGPAWIWPHNDRMLNMSERLKLKVFKQYASGKLVFQDETGAVRRDLDFSTMANALRIDGGIAALTDSLASGLDQDRVRLGHRVHRIRRDGDAITVDAEAPDGVITLTTGTVVLALPPRVIAQTIAFEPCLGAGVDIALQAIPTWMAGQAKVVAIYETPFWREMGLSGDAISHRGPMIEMHDASTMDATAGALFGFIGTPITNRRGRESEMRDAVVAQFVDLFGERAARPTKVFYIDWAAEAETATSLDFDAPSHHPAYGMPATLQNIWDGTLIFAGTEVSAYHGGFLEGALEAAEAAFTRISKTDANATK
jgi:monoamine oxidase